MTSFNHRRLDEICREIRDIADKVGAKAIGPVPL
ncbi:MAG: 30S ribosomal protein S10, partial [Candidatus Bathyarchaeia archaeon]